MTQTFNNQRKFWMQPQNKLNENLKGFCEIRW